MAIMAVICKSATKHPIFIKSQIRWEVCLLPDKAKRDRYSLFHCRIANWNSCLNFEPWGVKQKHRVGWHFYGCCITVKDIVGGSKCPWAAESSSRSDYILWQGASISDTECPASKWWHPDHNVPIAALWPGLNLFSSLIDNSLSSSIPSKKICMR